MAKMYILRLTKIDELASSDEDSIDELEDEYSVTETANTRSKPKSKALSGTKGKLVPFDEFQIPKGDKSQIDKFLGARTTEDGVEEVLVKYKNMSYLSTEWVAVKMLEQDRATKTRVRRFWDKPTWDNQWSEDEPFNPAYTKVTIYLFRLTV
jgi:hypothetical protein